MSASHQLRIDNYLDYTRGVPTAICSCGWCYTMEERGCIPLKGGETTRQFVRGYLTAVHSLHITQETANRLDGKTEITLRVLASELKTGTPIDVLTSFMSGGPVSAQSVMRCRPCELCLSLQLPYDDFNSSRTLEHIIQSQRLTIIVPN